MQWKKVLYEDSEVICGIAGQNELVLYSKVQDPPKLRLGAPGGGTLGAISFNDTTHGEREMVLVMGKDHDPDSPSDSLKCGSLDVQALIEGSSGADADMKKSVLLTPHRANFRVPVEQGTAPAPSSPWPTTAPVARDGSGGGASFIPAYQNIMSDYLHRPASAAQKALVVTYVDKYGYIDNTAFNWIYSTFIDSGLVT